MRNPGRERIVIRRQLTASPGDAAKDAENGVRYEPRSLVGHSLPSPISPGGNLRYDPRMELLRESIAARNAACERDRLAVRERLASAVKEYLPTGTRVWVYGSLNESGRFREWSDVDVALEVDPPGMSIYLLAGLLAERCGRPVDVCLLGETRLGPAIRRGGESWTV